MGTKAFPTGTRTRVLWVKTTYPNQLDYREYVCSAQITLSITPLASRRATLKPTGMSQP